MDGEIQIGFGRLPALARRQRSERHPETFAFLGFTHYCGWTRDGRFIVKHKTQSKRLTRKLKALRQDAWRLMHAPLAEQHHWYSSVLRGHYGYFGMPHNWRSLNGFRQEVRRIWFNCLRRRRQKNRHTASGTMRIASGKSRVREKSRLPGSVRAKPNGRATRLEK